MQPYPKFKPIHNLIWKRVSADGILQHLEAAISDYQSSEKQEAPA